MNLVPLDIRFLNIVRDHLRNLRTLTNEPNPTAANVRQLSIPLYALLVEGQLGKAYRMLYGKKAIRVQAPVANVETTLPVTPVIFCTGGASTLGNVNGIYMLPMKSDGSAPPQVQIKRVRCSLKEFQQRRRMQVNGTWVSTTAVIKYVANKDGGRHYDRNRGKSNNDTQFKAIDASMESRECFADPFIIGWQLTPYSPDLPLFVWGESGSQILGLPSHLYELLSIANDLIKSNSIRKLLGRLDTSEMPDDPK
jgi:hypothetical protein